MTCMTHCKSVALTSRPWKGKSTSHIAAFLHASTIQTNGNKHTRTLGWHFQKLQHISNFSTMPNHSYDSTFNGACQPSLRLQKRYTFLLLVFHFDFLAHFKKRETFPTVYFPDSNQVHWTFPYIFTELTSHSQSSHKQSVLSSFPNTTVRSLPPQPMLMPFRRRAGWQKTVPSNVSSRGKLVKSLVTRTTILRMNVYYAHSANAPTIDDGASPPGSIEVDDDTGLNCKMPKALY